MESSYKTSQRTYDEMPVLALVAVFSKHNEPIMLRNYLCEYLEHEIQEKCKKSLKNSKENGSSSFNETNELGVESKVDF